MTSRSRAFNRLVRSVSNASLLSTAFFNYLLSGGGNTVDYNNLF